MKRNETERNEPCFMIKVMTCFEHTLFLCVVVGVAASVVQFYFHDESLFVFRLIQFCAFAAIVVVVQE